MIVDIYNTNKKYNIIYADPPWTYEKTGGTKSSRGMAKQFYQTMSVDDIKNLPVKNLSENDCVLFLWVTYPKLQEGLNVIKDGDLIILDLRLIGLKKQQQEKIFSAWDIGQERILNVAY